MIFIYKKWDSFCAKLKKSGIQSIPACEVKTDNSNYLVLKHDVETNVLSAYRMAYIERKYGHRGSYYVQAYLLESQDNIKLLQEIKAMGHEVSYHHDVMDSCKGDLEKAIIEFEKNRRKFEANGLKVITVCQHGNPIIERIGYTSNRDFFRSKKVCEIYSDIADIMVNYQGKFGTKYIYFSDAGRIFNQIYDPINNDIVHSGDKDIAYSNLNSLFENLSSVQGNIISIHPHRWTDSAVKYIIKDVVFKTVRVLAKLVIKIPIMRKVMSRYYYLAKKI